MNKSKLSIVGFLALAVLLLTTGVAQAVVTVNSTSVTGSAALTLTGAAASNVDLGSATTSGVIAVGVLNTGGINIGAGNTAKTIAIGTGTAIDTINIGTGGTSADVITIGDAKADIDLAGEDIALTSADDIHIVSTTALGIINIGATTAVTHTINIGTVDAVQTIHIGDNASPANVITIGGAASKLTISTDSWDVSSTGAVSGLTGLLVASGTVTITPATTITGALTANGGVSGNVTGNLTGNVAGAAGAPLSLDSVASQTVVLGDINATTIALGSTAATTINIGNGGALTRAINIGTGSGADTISIGTGAGADVLAIGNNAGTLVIDTANWDISAAGVVTGFTGIVTGMITDGTIATADLADAAITEAKLATSSGFGLGALRTARATYVISDGATVGTQTLATTATIPDNAIIVGGIINSTTAVVGSTSSVAVGTTAGSSTTSILGATAESTLSLDALVNSAATFASPVKMSAAGDINVTISGNALTGGVIEITVLYFVAAN